MEKIIFNCLKISLFILFFSFVFVQKSDAAIGNCSITTTPQEITSETKSVNVKVSNTSGDLAPNVNYNIKIGGTDACVVDTSTYSNRCPEKQTSLDGSGNLNAEIPLPKTLKEGGYSITVSDVKAKKLVCEHKFEIKATSGKGGTNCTVKFTNENCSNPNGCFKPSDLISAYITGSLAESGNADDSIRVYIKADNNAGATIWNGCIKRGELISSKGYNFGYLTTGNYYLQVQDKCNTSELFFWNAENMACNASFYIDPKGGGISGKGDTVNQSPITPCANGSNTTGACNSVNTGLGITVGTNPLSLIRSIFGLILSVSGGIALLLIVFSGYRMMASQGNPEAVKEAREQLTAAVVGLLFIIFALVILQIIGYDILKIPGFGPSQQALNNHGK